MAGDGGVGRRHDADPADVGSAQRSLPRQDPHRSAARTPSKIPHECRVAKSCSLSSTVLWCVRVLARGCTHGPRARLGGGCVLTRGWAGGRWGAVTRGGADARAGWWCGRAHTGDPGNVVVPLRPGHASDVRQGRPHPLLEPHGACRRREQHHVRTAFFCQLEFRRALVPQAPGDRLHVLLRRPGVHLLAHRHVQRRQRHGKLVRTGARVAQAAGRRGLRLRRPARVLLQGLERQVCRAAQAHVHGAGVPRTGCLARAGPAPPCHPACLPPPLRPRLPATRNQPWGGGGLRRCMHQRARHGTCLASCTAFA